MPILKNLIDKGSDAKAFGTWRRATGDGHMWAEAITGLVNGHWSLAGLWGGKAMVHMALRTQETIAVLGLPCPEGRFPSVGRHHPPAIRLERSLCDLYGLKALGAHDNRGWLDHGNWGVRHPLGAAETDTGQGDPYTFLPAEGNSLHQIAVGPVHAGIIEPGHFRFNVNGEIVIRLEERFGYTHKGIEGLLAGSDIENAARIAGRICGDSTVAYASGFARAVEAALGIDVPVRAVWLRALMAELERLANHLGDIGAVCNDAAFALMHAECGILREQVLRSAKTVFGHRLMMDCVIPGGVCQDIDKRDAEHFRQLLSKIHNRFNALVELYDNTASLQDRTVGAGVVPEPLVRLYAPGGYVGRACGMSSDTRKNPGYEPYGELTFSVPSLDSGDVNARIWIRIKEVEQTLSLIGQILDRLPDGPIQTSLTQNNAGAAEGLSITEGFRGDILIWVKVSGNGTIQQGHFRDPSWFQWPLLEAAIKDNIVADFPLCNKSFNCAYSGVDL